jgi:hypothetical protein
MRPYTYVIVPQFSHIVLIASLWNCSCSVSVLEGGKVGVLHGRTCVQLTRLEGIIG